LSATPAQPAALPRLERLRGSDFRTLLIWLLLGAVGVGIACKYYFQAFPEASINFQITRSQALDQARQFIAQQGASVAGYESTMVFSVDDEAKTYLERTVGLQQANQLMSSQISVWYWEGRFFRPKQKEEFHVRISPAGQLVGFEHIVEEARPGASLDRAAAQAKAGNFLRARLGAGLDAYDFLPDEANSTERPSRRDWSFTWQRRGFRAPDNADGAPYQLHVGVQGADIGEYREFLKVPDAWKRGYARLRSSNDLLEDFALLPYMLLMSAAFWLIYDLARRGLLRWSQALWLGVFFAFLYFFMTMNDWPLTRSDYNTTSSYSAFVMEQVAIAAVLSIGQALLVSLAVAPGEVLYRASQPARVKLNIAWRLPGLRSKEFFTAGIIGISLAAIHIGYIVIFYILGRHIGVWAPQDINYDSSTTSILPWLSALTIGLYAAASEEFLFRMFAIPFVHRLTRSKFLAVVLPAFMWSFLHANYPQEPAYTRGIEIGLIGIVAGLVMLRWGILATLVWHYTVDASLGSFLLLRSASPYLRLSGALVSGAALLPLIYCGVMYLRRGGFEVREDILNSSDPISSESADEAQAAASTTERPATATRYESIPRKLAWLLIVCGVAGAMLLAFTRQPAIGDFARTSLDGWEAGARADAVLRQWHVEPARFHQTVIFLPNFDPATDEFLAQKVGINGANQIYEEKVPQVFWRVRYFRDLDPEEFVVLFRADGALHSVWHILPETAPGASLTKDAALALAQNWLQENKHMDFAEWRLADTRSETKPKRVDHMFVWEQIAPLAGGPAPVTAAYARVELRVQGDEISTYRTYIKLPEDWLRQREQATALSVLGSIWLYLFPIALGVFVLVVYLRNLKSSEASSIPWRKFAKWALWALLAFVVSEICGLPEAFNRYDTSIPLKAFFATLGIGWLLGTALFFSVIAFLFGLGWFLWTRAGRRDSLPSWLGMSPAYYRDALLIALFGGAAWLGFARLLSVVLQKVFGPGVASAAFEAFDSLFPAAQSVAGAVFSALLVSAIIAVVVGFVANYVRNRWLQILFILAVVLARMQESHSGAGFARNFILELGMLCFAWWGISRLVRFNLLAYFLLTITLVLVQEGVTLLKQPNAFLHVNGVAVLGACALLLIWPLIAWRGKTSSQSTVSTS